MEKLIEIIVVLSGSFGEWDLGLGPWSCDLRCTIRFRIRGQGIDYSNGKSLLR